jgi:CDGSH iron-sulfur domain-containing protein 3
MDPKIEKKAYYVVELQAGKAAYWCACGKSKNQPFCDGSHRDSEFLPLSFLPIETGNQYLCGCKQTRNPPYCDGTHKKL